MHSSRGSFPQINMLGLMNRFLKDEPRQSILEQFHGGIIIVILTTQYDNIF